MIKLTITHTCGHTAVHGFTGAESELRRREEWLRRQPCQACWREQQQSAADAQRQDWNLPALEGTAETIGWAEVIRMKAIAHNKEYHQRMMQGDVLRGEDEVMRSAIIGAADAAMHALEQERSAGWWVDHRFDALSFVKRSVQEAIAPILAARAAS